MMKKLHTYPPFDPRELEVIGGHKCGALGLFANMGLTGLPEFEPIFNRPITPRENLTRALRGENYCYMPQVGWAYCDINGFRPRIIADNVATRVVADGGPAYTWESEIGHGWFNLDWVFVPVAGGATVCPGKPLIEDMNDWGELIQWPDLDALDWEAMGEENREYLNTPQMNQLSITSNSWERLISLMDMEGAAMAMIDEDQADALHAFFDRYSDFLIDCIDRVYRHCDIQCVQLSDDWGHQNGPFFSLDTAMEKLVPYLKKVSDAVHARGMFLELHSCGKNESLVPAYIAAGVDFWCPQDINDMDMLVEKYKDAPIWFGMPDVPIAPGTSDDEIRAIAAQWFDKYKDYKVMIGFKQPNFVFQAEVYRLSREYLLTKQ